MTNLLHSAISSINTWFKQLQVRHFLSVVLIGFLLLTSTACSSSSSTFDRTSDNNVGRKVDTAIRQNDSNRPKTTGEWNKQARETKNAPGEKVKRITEQSKEAVKEFGKVYPDTAKKSARSLNENAS